MKINVICVGEMREMPLRELLSRYAARIPHYMPFEITVIPDIKAGRNLTADLQKQREGEAILSRIASGDFVMLLDERGKEMTSREFAVFIDKKASTLSRNLVFVIGGPYGFSQAVYDRADRMLGLSRMTFTHEMARVLAVEQIYRAMTILRGEPYHHD
ncbi:MAG: 23S rRNA (pseudouridine(1915)-N(3))-methyltransferase RlmH [Bacteroidales bacterium]|nr:23S rRNA (pseudouridine(1915)-N(3))-methyltransferase RlmH [Bacteroidales bacterium]